MPRWSNEKTFTEKTTKMDIKVLIGDDENILEIFVLSANGDNLIAQGMVKKSKLIIGKPISHWDNLKSLDQSIASNISNISAKQETEK